MLGPTSIGYSCNTIIPKSPSNSDRYDTVLSAKQHENQLRNCGMVMRLPSKKRLMIRTRLPPPEVIPAKQYKRRIRFAEKGNDVVKTVHRYPKPSVKHYPNLYFSSHEKAEIQFLASSIGESFLFEEEESVEHLEATFYKCDRVQSTDPSKKSEKEKLMKESIAALQQWADTEARGLEDVVSAEFEDVRRRTVAMILEYQEYLRKTLGTTRDSDELMRAFSEKTSARSRIFSALMAQGDAHVVRMQEEEEEASTPCIV